MVNRLIESVPLPVQDAVRDSAPVGLSDSFLRDAQPHLNVAHPLVEPLETFKLHAERAQNLRGPIGPILNPGPLTVVGAMSHARFHTPLIVNQGNRGTCWAWAGAAALEAAYARIGIIVKLSPQYLFHIVKAHENHRGGPGIHSLVGFGGSSDIVHHQTRLSISLEAHAPYIDQTPLQALGNSIPNTGMALSASGGGTLEQADWFEFDLRNIPLKARWFAEWGVAEYGQLTNFTDDDVKNVINSGFDLVVDVDDKINGGGHVIVIYGYNDFTSSFEIKNSQFSPGLSTMLYAGDPQFDLLRGSAFYVTRVKTPQPQWGAMWAGRWEVDYDGTRALLVIRRFTDLFGVDELPGPFSRISLGTIYGEDGLPTDVFGHFVDDGRGLRCNVGGRDFELFLHAGDPFHASGRVFINGTFFGVELSRGTAAGAGSGFTRAEATGYWDIAVDGTRATLKLAGDPEYTDAFSTQPRPVTVDPVSQTNPHELGVHVPFISNTDDQLLQLFLHTQEDALLAGLTTSNGRTLPIEGRMSRNLYAIQDDGTLRWYRNDGRSKLAAEWTGPNIVGTGWDSFVRVFGGGDGVIYGIHPNGDLLWYYHDGRNEGTEDWQGPIQVGNGWGNFTRVFGGDGGSIYGVPPDGTLLWYRHFGRRGGGPSWLGPVEVGTGWNGFTALTAAPDGCIYGVQPDGTLLWYRHYGHDQGYPIWHGPVQVGTGWNIFDSIWAAGNGYIYARTSAHGGDLWLWRHHGFLNGATSWTAGVKVGNGWGGGMREVFTT